MQSTPTGEPPNEKEREKQKGLDDFLFATKILFGTVVFALISALIGVWNGTGADFGTVVLTAAIVIITALQSLFMKFNYELACWQVRISQQALDIALIEANAATRMADEAFLANLSKRQRKKYERARRKQQEGGCRSDSAPQVEAVSPVPQSAIEAEHRPNTQHTANQNPQRRRNWWERIVIWQVVFSGVVAFCAAAQFWTSYKQWEATDKQWQVMVAEQRPWIGFDGIPRMERFAVAKDITIDLSVRNTGHSPARIVGIAFDMNMLRLTMAESISPTHHSVTKEMPFDLKSSLTAARTKQLKQAQRLVAAGETTAFTIATESRLTDDMLRPIEAGVMQPVLLLYVTYSVVGSTDLHETWSLFLYDRDRGEWYRNTSYDHMD